MAGEAQGDLRLENLRWSPIYHNHGGADELVPVTSAIASVDALDALDYRYRFDLYPAADHVGYAIQDHFEDAVEFMTEQGEREPDPGHITYRWTPTDVNAALGVGPAGAWWVREAVARGAGQARGDALSFAKPDAIVDVERIVDELRPDAMPSPAIRDALYWVPTGMFPLAEDRLTLDLDNVGSLTIDLARAGFVPAGTAGDWDGDGVADPVDNCRFTPNPDQSDAGGLGTAGSDGIGDVCQCGDVSDNGRTNGQDGNAIRRYGLSLEPNLSFLNLRKCDVTGNGLCNGQDGNAVRAASLGLASLYDPTACSAHSGERVVDVDTDGPAQLTLSELVPGTQVQLDGVPVGAAGGDGRAVVAVPTGQHQVSLAP
jgi:hypothetical protein